MLNITPQLISLSAKEDLVFVGGIAMVAHGIKKSFNDIDIVITSTSGLSNITTYQTDSAFSKSGNRAFILKTELSMEMDIDIFIENELPDYEIINGLKIITKDAMAQYYNSIKNRVNSHFINNIETNLSLITHNLNTLLDE